MSKKSESSKVNLPQKRKVNHATLNVAIRPRLPKKESTLAGEAESLVNKALRKERFIKLKKAIDEEKAQKHKLKKQLEQMRNEIESSLS